MNKSSFSVKLSVFFATLFVLQLSSCNRNTEPLPSEHRDDIAQIASDALIHMKNDFGKYVVYTNEAIYLDSKGLSNSNLTYLSNKYVPDNISWQAQINQTNSTNNAGGRIESDVTEIDQAMSQMVNGKIAPANTQFKYYSSVQIDLINQLLDAITISTTFPILKSKIINVENSLQYAFISNDKRTEVLAMIQSLFVIISDFERANTSGNYSWLESKYGVDLPGLRVGTNDASARIEANCVINVKGILRSGVFGGMIGGVRGAYAGATAGTFTVPLLGTATGAVNGFVFGFAAGFAVGAGRNLVYQIMNNCNNTPGWLVPIKDVSPIVSPLNGRPINPGPIPIPNSLTLTL